MSTEYAGRRERGIRRQIKLRNLIRWGEQLESRRLLALNLGPVAPPFNASHSFFVENATATQGTLSTDTSTLFLEPSDTTGSVDLRARFVGGSVGSPSHALTLASFGFEVRDAVGGGVVLSTPFDSLDLGTNTLVVDFSLNSLAEGLHQFEYFLTNSIFGPATTSAVSSVNVVNRTSQDITPPTVAIVAATLNDELSGDELFDVPIAINDGPGGVGAQIDLSLTVFDAAIVGFANQVTLRSTVIDPNGGMNTTTEAVFNVSEGTAVSDTALYSQLFTDPGKYTLQFEAEDQAGLLGQTETSFYVLGQSSTQPTRNAPGTPVYSEIFDLRNTLGSLPSNYSQVWQMAFDRSTQTVWLNAELGDKVIHFDPARSDARVFDLAALPVDRSNPHGISFDFDSHVSPGVWIAHRNVPLASTLEGAEGGPGMLSFLMVEPISGNEHLLITYDSSQWTGLHAEDFHAVTVDAKGDVWVVADHDNKILRFRFPNVLPNDESALANISPEIKVFDVPNALVDRPFFMPHGIEVVVDDRTGEQFVWMVAEGGMGQVALLRPEAAADGSDVWLSWVGLSSDFTDGTRGTFVEVDDNETPGLPYDDRVIAMFPVKRPPGLGNPGGVATDTFGLVYILDPGDLGPPADGGTATVTAFQVPKPSPDAPGSNNYAAINQMFAGREGGAFFVDRLGAVGRIDLDATAAADILLPQTPLTTRVVITPAAPVLKQLVPPIITRVAWDTAAPDPTLYDTPLGMDLSTVSGLDQHVLTGEQKAISGQDKGAGAFRGTANAANVIYGSISQNDMISTTVFAEASRRQMSVVASPVSPSTASVTRGRMAFQVLRDGSLVMTARAHGQLIDVQVNLTKRLGRAITDDLLIDGDVSAVGLPSGNVLVFGKNMEGGLAVFQFRPNGGAAWNTNSSLLQHWSAYSLRSPDAAGLSDVGIIVGNPTSYREDDGEVFAVVTTSQGHLLRYGLKPKDAPVDLTDESGASLATQVMYADVAVVQGNGLVYFYGANQQGDLIQYRQTETGFTAQTIERLVAADRRTMVFQSVNAAARLDSQGRRHVFATDGHSQLVHFAISGVSTTDVAENVSHSVTDNGQGYGYFAFQERFAGRVYSDLAVVLDGDALSVFGTNGGDLVRFTQASNGTWEAANLTNDIHAIYGDIADPRRLGLGRTPANKVFGSPNAYLLPQGEVHVLQINKEGEVIEYASTPRGATPAGLPRGFFTTQNVNLLTGLATTELSLAEEPLHHAVSDWLSGDFDGNGKLDLVVGVGGRWLVARATAASFANEDWGTTWSLEDTVEIFVGDVNGDGRDDIIGRTDDGRWQVAVSDSSSFDVQTWGRWTSQFDWLDLNVGDFNGDGNADIAGRAPNGAWWVGLSNGTQFVSSPWIRWNPRVFWQDVLVGDFNRDGRDDVTGRGTHGVWWTATSTGSQFRNERWGGPWSTNTLWNDVLVGDLNGDGRADVLGRSPAGRWWANISNGQRFTTKSLGRWSTNVPWYDVQLADVNQDGRMDVLGRTRNGAWFVGESDGQALTNRVFARWPNVGSDPANVLAAFAGNLDNTGGDDVAGLIRTDWLASLSVDNAVANNEDWGDLDNVLTADELASLRSSA